MPAFTIELPNGKRLDVEADDENAAMSGAQDWFKQNVTNKTDTSATGALQQGMTDAVSGVGKTIKEYISPETGKAVMGAAASKADPKYKSAYEGFARPEDGADNHFMGLDWKQAPRALLEQAPGLAVDVGTQMLLKKLGVGGLGRTVAGMTTFGARTAGNEAQKRADARTGAEGSEPNVEDKAIGLGSTALQGALNTFAAGKIAAPGNAAKGILPAAGNVAKAAAAEAGTSGAQDLISQGATTAGTDAKIDLKDTLAQTVLGGAGGGTFAAPHLVKAGAQAAGTRGTDYGSHSTLAANRLTEKAGGVEKLEDPKVAFSAMRAAQDNVSTELNAAASKITAPSTDTANALARARAGEILNSREMSAIDAEGNDTLSSLVRQQAALTKMTKRGNFDTTGERWAGGASETARKYSGRALTTLGGIPAVMHMASNGAAGLDSISATIPGAAGAIAGGVAAYGALKKIEKAAGTSSPARSFAERFSDGSQVRPDVQSTQSPTGPKVVPQNSLTPSQPWGPVADKPTPFKPDMLESNLQKIVDKLQNQKRRDNSQEVMPLLRQLAEQNRPTPEAPGIDVKAIEEEIRGRMLMASRHRQEEGKRVAEAEAAESPMVNAQGGLDAVRNPAMGKRAQEIISATNALERLRRQPEEQEAPPIAPEQPTPPEAPPSPTPEAFTLPESPHVFKDPETAARDILLEAVAGGKEIRHTAGFKAGTQRRLAGEEAIYNNISSALTSVQERGAFHPYLSALWGSDSPEVVKQVRDHMLAAFPQHAATINKHLSDEAIKGLWTKPKKKK